MVRADLTKIGYRDNRILFGCSRFLPQPSWLMGSADEILIQELELRARVGVPDAERAQPQRITVSLLLQPRISFASLNDELKKAVDYAAICSELQRFVAGREAKLIETFAHEMAEHLLQQFNLVRVELELRKFILPETRSVAARVVRSRAVGGE